ncbi:MAG TPA: hypothetical protein VF665_12295 [Longimicrobium sp.]|uniref:hypothetical protein n=1 Tax=Longimicrobium sp. TaxID=2029185 RepID=UPI002ED7F4F0
MKKLKLAVEQLDVVSFRPSEKDDPRPGTVNAHMKPPTYEFCTWESYCPCSGYYWCND